MRRWQTGGRWGLGPRWETLTIPHVASQAITWDGQLAPTSALWQTNTLLHLNTNTRTQATSTLCSSHMSFDIVLVGNSRTMRFVKQNWSSFYQRIQTNNDQLLWKEQDFVKRKTFSQVQVSTDIILVGRIKFWLKSGCKESSQAMFACHPLHRLVHYCIIPLLTFLQYPPQFFLHLLEFCSSHCCMQLRASHWLCALCRPEPVHQMRDNKKGWPNVLYWI